MASREEIVRFIYEVSGSKELADATGAMLKAGETADTTSEEFQKFSKALSDATAKAKQIGQAIDLQDKIKKNAAAFAEATAGLDALNKEFSKTDKSSADVAAKFKQAQAAVTALAKEESTLQRQFADTEATLRKAGVNTDNLGASLNKAKGEVTGAAASLSSLGTASKETTNLLGFLADNLGKIATIAAATKIALAGIHFSEDAFKDASKVEAQLDRVQASVGTAVDAFQRFGPAVEEASRQVNVSTEQAAAGLNALVQQGQSADEALQSLIPTLRLAKIAQIDVAQAAGIVDDALDRFGLSTAQAGDVVDIFVTAARGAKDGVAGIAGAMQAVAPLARELGLSFKDTAAILGLLQQNGIDAGSAVRGLRTIFADLQDPASKLRLNLRSLGDEGGDFATAIDTIAGSGARGKKTLLDLDGASRVLVTFLAQQGSGAIQKFSDALDKSQGSAQRFVDTINKGAGESFDTLSNAISRAAGSLAQPFLEPVANELRKLAGEIDDFAKSDDFEQIRGQLVKFANDAVKALDELIHGLKWDDLKNGAKGAVDGITQDFHTLAENTSAVVNAISKVTAAIVILKNLGDIGPDIAKTLFGGTVDAAIEGALKISKAQDLVRGSVSETTKALERYAASAKALRDSGVQGFAQDAEEGAAAIKKLGDSAETTGGKFAGVAAGIESTATAVEKAKDAFSGVEAGVTSTADALGNFNDEIASGPPALDALSQSSDNLARANRSAHDAIVQASDAANAAHDAYRSLRESGTATAEELERAGNAAIEADTKLARLLETANGGKTKVLSLAEALKLLGTSHDELVAKAGTSEAALNALYQNFLQTGKGVEDVRAEFQKWAADLRASVANSDQWEKDTAENTIRVKAALLGVTDAFGKVGQVRLKPPDTEGFKRGVEDLHEGIGKIVGDTSGLTFQTQQQADAFEELGGKAGSLGPVLDILQGQYARFSAVSSAAVQKFTDTMNAFFNSNNTRFSFDALTDLTNIRRAGEAAVLAGQFVQNLVDQQRAGVEGFASQLQTMTDAQLENLAKVRGGADALAESLAGDAAAAREGKSAFDLLGAADLGPLQSALDATADRVRQIADEAKAAREEIQNIAGDLRDQLDEINGNQKAIEDRRFEAQIQQIKDAAELAGTLNSTETLETLRLAKEVHEAKLKQIADEAAAKKKADDDVAANANKNSGGGGGSGGDNGGAPAAPSGPHPLPPITVTINGTVIGGTEQQVADGLTRLLLPQLQNIIRRSQ